MSTTRRLLVDSTVLALCRAQGAPSGVLWLVGAWRDDAALVVAAMSAAGVLANATSAMECAAASLPGGTTLLGVAAVVGAAAGARGLAAKLAGALLAMVCSARSGAVIELMVGSEGVLEDALLHTAGGVSTPVPWAVGDAAGELRAKSVLLRCAVAAPAGALENIFAALAAGQALFKLPDGGIVSLAKDALEAGHGRGARLLRECVANSVSLPSSIPPAPGRAAVCSVMLLTRLSTRARLCAPPVVALAPFTHGHAPESCSSRSAVHADVLVYCDFTSTLSAALFAISTALSVQARHLRSLAALDLTVVDGVVPSAFHFAPPPLQLPITGLYAMPGSFFAAASLQAALAVSSPAAAPAWGSAAEEARQAAQVGADVADASAAAPALAAARFRLHGAFFLPMDRPLLRTAQALRFFPSALGAGGPLRDVHHSIPPPSAAAAPGANVQLVAGSYEYYHYMQGRFDDKGWGCAYRSLQTLVSWFMLAQYGGARVTIPSHRDIQQCLVTIGDKPSSFVGSRGWIGSQEVGYVLNQLLGVESKYIIAASGAELPGKAREIMHHFQSQGTPVMMGGGMLAFTVLGVAYDSRSGACQLLILDPHYCGADDLKEITGKAFALEGYRAVPCSWRSTESFSQKDFYSLCCPQRPPACP